MPGGFSASRPHGEAEWAGGDGATIVRDCLQCCHCAGHFFVCPGSGKKRGWCMNCSQVTCGRVACEPCCHWKKKIELIDSGRVAREILRGGRLPDLPVSVSNPGIILGKG